jgi:hypothetical protein
MESSDRKAGGPDIRTTARRLKPRAKISARWAPATIDGELIAVIVLCNK